MSQVFISYMHEDAEDMRRLKAALEARGVEVWIDSDAIEAGDRWQDAVRDGVAAGVAFIACFSQHFLDREPNVMWEELRQAIAGLRRRGPRSGWFVPLLLDGVDQRRVPPDMEVSPTENLRDYEWVTLDRNWDDGIERILRRVAPSEAAQVREARVREVEAPQPAAPAAARALPRYTGRAPAWDIPPRRRVRYVPDGPIVTALAADPHDRWIATGTADGLVRLWPAPRGERPVEFEHGDRVQQLEVSANGRWLVSAGGAVVRLCDAQSPGSPVALDLDGLVHPERAPAVRVAFSASGDLLAAANPTGELRVCDIESGRRLPRAPARENVLTVAFGPYERLLATGSVAGSVRIIDVETGQTLMSDDALRESHRGAIEDLTFSPDGAILVARSEGGLLRAWDVESRGAEERQLWRKDVEAIAFGPSPTVLVGAGPNGVTWLCDVDSGEEIASFDPADALEQVLPSPDGTLVATRSSAGRVHVCDVNTRDRVPIENAVVRRVAFADSGDVLVTAGLPRLGKSALDRTEDELRLWALPVG